jgi:hypothetical protein
MPAQPQSKTPAKPLEDYEFDPELYLMEIYAAWLMQGSIDDCIEQASLIQGVFDQSGVHFRKQANGYTNTLVVNKSFNSVFKKGGALDKAILSAPPHLDFSWLRAYKDSNNSLHKGFEYSVTSCVGIVTWGRRAFWERRKAVEEGRNPLIEIPLDFMDKSLRDVLLLPLCLVGISHNKPPVTS